MKAIDFRNATFANLTWELTTLRLLVWEAWIKYGPGTTREVADKAGMDVLRLRPRTTELMELGAVELVGGREGEGIYRGRGLMEWEEWFERESRFHRDVDRQLKLI